jgi:hypothetical protein
VPLVKVASNHSVLLVHRISPLIAHSTGNDIPDYSFQQSRVLQKVEKSRVQPWTNTWFLDVSQRPRVFRLMETSQLPMFSRPWMGTFLLSDEALHSTTARSTYRARCQSWSIELDHRSIANSTVFDSAIGL